MRIGFIAPFETRVQRIAQIQDLAEEQARHVVLEADHARQHFLRDFFGCDPDDPHHYDLVINTAQLSLEHGAELVLMCLRQTWQETT